jgi:hypothetical protein
MVRLAATLERVEVADKCLLGQWLLKRLEKASEPEQTAWALGRVGARILFHGSAHQVVPVATVSDWLETLLKADWKKQAHFAFAATLLARCCDDRSRDIDDSLRIRVVDKLKQAKAPDAWIDRVSHFQVLDAAQEKQVFGEALPPGLRLLD